MDLMTKLPEMSDDALANLRTNAQRLRHTGTTRQQSEATLLLPAVEAELGARRQARLKAVRAAVANPRPQRRRVTKRPLRAAAEE